MTVIMNAPTNARVLNSTVTPEGTVELRIADVPLPPPGDDEIVVRMEAAPINPSDQGNLFGAADLGTLRREGASTVADIPEQRRRGMAGRLGRVLPMGNEGAGTVVAAGANAASLIGRVVAIAGAPSYATYRVVRAADALVLPPGTTPAECASAFINPLTALGMLETMHRDGHTALVHTAAASNLGQMLVRACLADGVPLVNIVRNADSVKLLRDAGAEYVCDQNDPEFDHALSDAIAATGATLAFDATGGGTLANRILVAMESALLRKTTEYSRYGTSVHKQVYLYGGLDTSPLVLDRSYGMAWDVGGWLLWPFLQSAGPETTARLRQRVADEITTTFASRYSATIGLDEALDVDHIRAYTRKATGEKYLIDPSR
jgi:NADPH:quinone reductase-like Zn-dependent oxidoreductase